MYRVHRPGGGLSMALRIDSLVARHLEANGIPTVVIATARDIVESAAVPRLLFVDFPLG